MSDIRLIHSLNTRPLIHGLDEKFGPRKMLTQMFFFALSVAYAKRLGQPITLHTDSFGKRLLGHLPYEDVKLTLDEPQIKAHRRFWASAKFEALMTEDSPCVHIDGDVFIKTPQALERLKRLHRDNDLVVQSADPAMMYVNETEIFMDDMEFTQMHWCLPDGLDAYNTGVLGFRDNKVKDAVCANYKAIVEHFSATRGEWLSSEESDMRTPDLIAEQKMIEVLSTEKCWHVGKMLESLKDAAALGYQHVYSVDKLNYLNACIETLRIIDPEIAETTERRWNELLNQIIELYNGESDSDK